MCVSNQGLPACEARFIPLYQWSDNTHGKQTTPSWQGQCGMLVNPITDHFVKTSHLSDAIIIELKRQKNIFNNIARNDVIENNDVRGPD